MLTMMRSSSSTLAFQVPISGFPRKSNHNFVVHRALASRSASAYILRTPHTTRNRLVVSCTLPNISTSESPQDPESYLIHTKDETQIVLPSNTELVSSPLPLGVFLDQTADGLVFVDEIEPDGNAAKLGQLVEGDVVRAVSLPFGNNLIPVPEVNGLQMIATYMRSRDTDEPLFHMAIRRGNDVEALRARLPSEIDVDSADATLELAKKIYVDEYPSLSPESVETQEDDHATRMKKLREYGFEMESVVEKYNENGTG